MLRRQRVGGPDAATAINGAILALHWVSFFAAIQVSSVAVGLLGYASFPLFVLLLERRLLRGGRFEWTIALLAVLGLVALVPDFRWSSGVVRGLSLGIVSAFTFALLAVRNKRLVEQMTPSRIALWQNLFAAACLAAIVAHIRLHLLMMIVGGFRILTKDVDSGRDQVVRVSRIDREL